MGVQLTRPPHHIVGIGKVDNDDLVCVVDNFTAVRASASSSFFARWSAALLLDKLDNVHANKVVRLERQVLERDGLGLDTQRRELRRVSCLRTEGSDNAMRTWTCSVNCKLSVTWMLSTA
jgi:hypothetical protein